MGYYDDNLEQFAREVLETLANHQNVGWSRKDMPFLDKEEAFDGIVGLALERGLLCENKENGLLVSAFPIEDYDRTSSRDDC